MARVLLADSVSWWFGFTRRGVSSVNRIPRPDGRRGTHGSVGGRFTVAESSDWINRVFDYLDRDDWLQRVPVFYGGILDKSYGHGDRRTADVVGLLNRR